MATLTANVLTEGQRVELDLGVETELLECRVIGFGGAHVVLAARPDELPPELAIGRSAYVVVGEGGQVVHALRARIREIMGGRGPTSCAPPTPTSR